MTIDNLPQRKPQSAPSLSARDALTKAFSEAASLDPVVSMAVDDGLSVVIKTADGKTYSIPTTEQIERSLAGLHDNLGGLGG